MPQFKRMVAHKLWIANVFNAPLIKKEGEFEPTFIQWKGNDISRMNCVATVTNKYESEDGNFSSLTVDDGSSAIRVKTWREDTSLLQPIKKGDIVRIVARIRHYNDEVYLLPEIVKPIEPNWELVHKLELLKLQGKPDKKVVKKQSSDPEVEEETVVSESNRQRILTFIEKLDKEGGANKKNLQEISSLQEDTITSIIEELLKEGEIFEVNGNFKTMN